MNEEMLNQLKAQTAILMTISRQLDTPAQANAPLSPNYRRRLAEYAHFDWAVIGATVIARDAQSQSQIKQYYIVSKELLIRYVKINNICLF